MKVTKEMRDYHKEMSDKEREKKRKFLQEIGKRGGLATKAKGTNYKKLAGKRWKKKLSTVLFDEDVDMQA